MKMTTDDLKKLEGFDALIAAINIFRKYHTPAYPFHCEHDTLYIGGIVPEEVSKEDIEALDVLGFFVSGEHEGFMSFRFGSC